jgi:hypothetical protein
MSYQLQVILDAARQFPLAPSSNGWPNHSWKMFISAARRTSDC